MWQDEITSSCIQSVEDEIRDLAFIVVDRLSCSAAIEPGLVVSIEEKVLQIGARAILLQQYSLKVCRRRTDDSASFA